MTKLYRWLPFLRWPRPNAALMRGELIASLTVAVVMIPQSVAYAQLAGMPLVTGLYATFLPMLVAVLFSSSSRLSVGPSALSCVLVGASLTGLAEPGSAQWVLLAVWLALLSGAIQLAVGAGGGAWVLNLVSSPVLSGFSQAAAILIIASQLPALVGLRGGLTSLWQGPAFDFEAMAYGVTYEADMLQARTFRAFETYFVITLVYLGMAVALRKLLFVGGKRWLPKWPMPLLAVGACAAISHATGYAARGGSVIGTLPQGLPSFYWPAWPGGEALAALIVPALVVALISSMEMASSAKIESQHDGKRWDANQDLVGQGLGKLTSALSGTFPTSTSFSRSAITLYSGARTGWATVCAAAVVLGVLLFLTPLLFHVPRAVLSAVVVTAVAGLVKPGFFKPLWQINRVEAVTAGLTFAVTLATAPRIYWGVLAGVLMGLAHFLYHRLHPRIIEVGLHPDGSLRDRHLWKLAPLAPDTYALRMDDELDFASASAFERALVEHLAAFPQTRHVCLFAQPINRIDATGVEVFRQLRTMLERRQVALHISGIKLPVEKVLRKSGALDEGPLLHMYRTDVEALLAFGRLSP